VSLQSKFKVNRKLQDCAVQDKDHIGEATLPPSDRKGTHVGLIQEALNAWAQTQTPPVKPVAGGEVSAALFGSDTARVVTLFKTQKKLLNFKGEIDAIVGIKTVAALDLELPRLSDPDPTPPPPPSPQTADVVIKFQGAFEKGSLLPDNVLNGRRIIVYKPMPNQAFGNTVMQDPMTGRVLVRIGRKTTTIGTESLAVFAEVSRELQNVLSALDREPGTVFIHGSSSGGRNAIDFSRVAGPGLNPHFVAAVDAAFFQADTPSRPEANVDAPTTIPNFALSAGLTPNPRNFFQTIGNHAKRSLFHGVLFTSSMKGEEIHGPIAGFQNTDLTRFIPRALLRNDDDAHIACGGQGTAEVERLIADDLLLAS
jgi:hypothetical protein